MAIEATLSQNAHCVDLDNETELLGLCGGQFEPKPFCSGLDIIQPGRMKATQHILPITPSVAVNMSKVATLGHF